ncbi:hypothetical protein BJY59DRAFT_696405 [Rhodotorula toruloides]
MSAACFGAVEADLQAGKPARWRGADEQRQQSLTSPFDPLESPREFHSFSLPPHPSTACGHLAWSVLTGFDDGTSTPLPSVF